MQAPPLSGGKENGYMYYLDVYVMRMLAEIFKGLKRIGKFI